MSNDWRVFRPAIWLAMLGVALVLLVSPAYVGALVLGFSLGVGIRIERRRRAPARPPARRPARRRRRR